MASLLICEDDPRLARLLTRTLERQADLSVEACTTGERACALLASGSYDLLLLDLELPGMGGLEVLERLREEGRLAVVEVLILTTFRDEERIYRAVRAGAAGYLVKAHGIETLVESVREVLAGGTVIDPGLGRRFWRHLASQRGDAEVSFALTAEEREVLGMVARGLTNPETASALGRSARSIKSELSTIYRKLGVCGRVEAAAVALRAGLIEL